jgi:riboflavin synthase
MFTGIVQGIGNVLSIESRPNFKHVVIGMNPEWLADLKIGASISIEGVCLTVVNFTSETAEFDIIGETLQRTTLKDLREADAVNIERAARFGDEIGGHLLSGHIMGTASVDSVERIGDNCVMWLCCPKEWMKYLFSKGYIALNGASLTLVEVDKAVGRFSVHLIPETLRKTTLGTKKARELVNIEIDAQTQAIVETVESFYAQMEK